MKGRLYNKVILVRSEGAWSVKPEAAPAAQRTTNRGQDEKGVELMSGFNKRSKRAAGKGKQPVEIIELDDD